MNDLVEQLRTSFDRGQDHRSGYAESFMNSWVAAQIRIIREQRGLTQQDLAEILGTKQAGISRLENTNYSSWKVQTLARLARAFDVRLRISFEEFGTLPRDLDNFGPESLKRDAYEEDNIFKSEVASAPERPTKRIHDIEAEPWDISFFSVPETMKFMDHQASLIAEKDREIAEMKERALAQIEVWLRRALAAESTVTELRTALEEKWISVKDRLPKASDPPMEYLIAFTNGDFGPYTSTAYWCVDEQENGWSERPWDDYLSHLNVTHWRPLPAPPQEQP